jgi:hypothetical protein
MVARARPAPSASLVLTIAEGFDAAPKTFRVVTVSGVSMHRNVCVRMPDLFEHLVRAGKQRDWHVQMGSRPLLDLLPDEGPSSHSKTPIVSVRRRRSWWLGVRSRDGFDEY